MHEASRAKQGNRIDGGQYSCGRRTHQYSAGRPPFNPWHHYTAREFAQSGFVFEGPRALLSAP
jgi:hypothetical protein